MMPIGHTDPIGTIRIRGHNGNQVRFIKVRDFGPIGRRWIQFARWWWEQNRGPVPAGKRVVERSTLRHALEVAARQFTEIVNSWKDAKPNPLVNESGIEQMRGLFSVYEHNTAALLNKLDGAAGVALLTNEDLESA
jgi:hypothetical protein